MKVSFWVYISNLGDGSAACLIFNSKASAEHYASFDEERFCDDIYKMELNVNDNGELISLQENGGVCNFINPVHFMEKE